MIEQIKSYMLRLVKGDPNPAETESPPLTANGDTMDKAQFDELSGKVEAMAGTLSGLDATIATAVGNALKPMIDAQAARDAADKAKADEEHAALVNKVVEGGLLTEELAKASPAPVLNALLSSTPKTAFRINGAFKPAGEKPGFTAPKGE